VRQSFEEERFHNCKCGVDDEHMEMHADPLGGDTPMTNDGFQD
jgi:hypothetical protein